MTSEPGQPPGQDDVNRMDDFQVIAERQRVMAALAALTDKYGHSTTRSAGGTP